PESLKVRVRVSALLGCRTPYVAAMPASTPPTWDSMHGTILKVLGLVERRMPLLTTGAGDQSRQVSAAYLARCRRLLIVMDRVREAEDVDVCNVLLRPLFEAWLHGMWVLLAGRDALTVLLDAYKTDVERIDRLAGLELDDPTPVDEPTEG